MKKYIFCILIVLLTSTTWAQEVSTSFVSSAAGQQLKTQFSNGLGLGFYKSGTSEVGVLTWNPDFRLGILGVGFNVNVGIGENKPTDLENIVVRYAELDTGTWGLRYGVLQNITLGYGLLMSGYSTNVTGGSILSNNQTGVKGYFRGDMYGVEALGTKSNVYGARITEKILPQLILGQTYVTDKNISGYSVDAGIPLTDWAGFYTEYARLNNYGGGITAGFGAGQDFTILAWNFKAERRLLDANFVPAYFNDQHDINPINMTSAEASGVRKDGYLVNLGAKALDIAGLSVTYENYNGGNPALEASAQLKYLDYFVSATFSQPNFQDFRGLQFDQGAILTGRTGYKINPFTSVIVNYKKAYDPGQARVVESQWYELAINF